jgi:hypothetical protein
MFLVAFAVLRTLYRGNADLRWEIGGLAALIGLISGVWTRWYPEIDSVQQAVPALEDTLLFTTLGLILCGLVALLFPIQTKITSSGDWRLSPIEWVVGIGFLGLVAAQRISQFEDFQVLGLVVALPVFIGLLILLWYHSTQYNEDAPNFFLYQLKKPALPVWLMVIIPLLLLNFIGYEVLPSTGKDPLQSQIVLLGIAVFGIVWIPIVSTWIGFQAAMELASEEY